LRVLVGLREDEVVIHEKIGCENDERVVVGVDVEWSTIQRSFLPQ
jgi:hypothetical protein